MEFGSFFYAKIFNMNLKKQYNPTNINTFEIINSVVSTMFNVPVKDIISKSKKTEILFARYAAMYIARHMFDFTLQRIGNEYSNRRHDTVIVALKTTDNVIESNIGYAYNLGKCWNHIKIMAHD